MHIILVPLLVAGVPIALTALAFLIHVLRTYLKAGYAQRFISAIPSPPLSKLKLLTTGHDAIRLFVTGERRASVSKILSWRARHGPIFAMRGLFGEPIIMLMSASAIAHISIRRPAIYHKSPLLRDMVGSIVEYSGLLLDEGKKHARLRKIVAPGMHHAALMSLSDVFMRHGEGLKNRLAKCVGREQGCKPIDMWEEAHLSTFSVIMDACFGNGVIPQEEVDRLRDKYFLCIREPPTHVVRRSLLQRMFSFLSPEHFGWQEQLKVEIKKTLVKHVRQFKTTWLQQRQDQQDERTNDENNATNSRASLLMLIARGGADEHLSEDEMVGLILTFLLGGQLTTSISTAWTLYNLATHPTCQTKLREELATWKVEDGIQALDVLPFLDRVVKETIRHDPPVLFTSRVAKEDDEIDGYRIPKGAMLRVPTYALQRDESIWGDDAHEFIPDRWLDAGIRKKSMFFSAFWFGCHGCIGQRFAILETKALTAHVIKCLEVSVDERDAPPTVFGPIAVPRNMQLYFRHVEI